MSTYYNPRKSRRRKSNKLRLIVIIEIVVLLSLSGAYYLVANNRKSNKEDNKSNSQDVKPDDSSTKDKPIVDDKPVITLTPEEQETIKEQNRIQQEIEERNVLVAEADKLLLSYDYDGAIEIVMGYKGKEGGYEVYPALDEAIKGYEATKESLVKYGGSYTSITQFNHIFFHSLVADNSKAFDGDYEEEGYNMYMTTVSEFKKIMEIMYADGYVLISMHDMVKLVPNEEGVLEYEPADIMLPQGKKPFVLSQDDVNYYNYMDGDGFASRIVIGDDGKPTTEMLLEDGSYVRGSFDIVPILDEFVEAHPDFSYKGAKGVLALTGYEGALGYRTDDPTSPTYEQDKETVKAVAQALKDNGWEFACHGWGHRHSYQISYEAFKKDTLRWMDEVAPLIGPTDYFIFPYGEDIETTMGHYKSDKFKLLKENGFNYFCGVDKAPWMHLKWDYIRMTRRPLDGQAMIQFPERLVDLFDPEVVKDPDRPARSW